MLSISTIYIELAKLIAASTDSKNFKALIDSIDDIELKKALELLDDDTFKKIVNSVDPDQVERIRKIDVELDGRYRRVVLGQSKVVSKGKFEYVLTNHTYDRVNTTINKMMGKGLSQEAEKLLSKKHFLIQIGQNNKCC